MPTVSTGRPLTEKEWLEAVDSFPLLKHLDAGVSERKFRLTECAFQRRFWHLLTDARSRRAVEVVERFADGLADRDELRAATADAELAFDDALVAHFPDRRPVRSYWGGAVSAAQHAATPFFDAPHPRFERWSFASLQWIATAGCPIDETRDH
jgi:hypothetical protein